MEAVNLSRVSKTNFTNKQEIQKETPKAPEQKKNGKKLLALGAAAVATIAVAGLAFKKGKLPKVTQVADLKFNKGVAIKGDEFFSGVAEHTNKKGDKFLLEYKNGVLQSSKKNINPETGAGSLEKGNFIKHYSKNDGKYKVSISEDTASGVQRRNCEVSKNHVTKAKSTGETEDFRFANGKINKYESSDGIIKKWYDNGQMKSENLPDGTEINWHENGQMSMKKLPDGSCCSWYENGQICYEEKEVALDNWLEPLKLEISYNPDGQVYRIDDVKFSKGILYRSSDGEYYTYNKHVRGESLENILNKLNIEVADINFY